MSATVTVACKMPHGLILRVFDMVEAQEPQPGGGTKAVPRALPRSRTVTINGYLPKYKPSLPPAAQGSSYALTHGVDKDFFDEWMKQNRDLDAVRNGLIYAHEKADYLVGKNRENEKRMCGLEPIDPSNLPKGISTFTKEAA